MEAIVSIEDIVVKPVKNPRKKIRRCWRCKQNVYIDWNNHPMRITCTDCVYNLYGLERKQNES